MVEQVLQHEGLVTECGQIYLLQGPDLERLQGIVESEILGPFGMGSLEVIQNIHTPKGFQKIMSTPL